jgi:U3 small nucleolar RNA-associated protein 19
MPAAVNGVAAKRKRAPTTESSRKRWRSESSSEDGNDAQERIFALEAAILESKKHYNNIATLLKILRSQDDKGSALTAAVALCRVYIRLLAAGALRRTSDFSEKDLVVVQWLRGRYAEYKEVLAALLGDDEAALTVLTLVMRLLKVESKGLETNDYQFPKEFLLLTVRSLLQEGVDDKTKREYVEKFVNEFDDVRFYTFKSIR